MSKPKTLWGTPCLGCGQENPPLNHFCSACGEPVHDAGHVTCPGCQQPNPWAAAFCGTCGTELMPAPTLV